MNNKRVMNIMNSLIDKNGKLNNSEIYSIIDKYNNAKNDFGLEQHIIEDYNALRKVHDEKLGNIKKYNQDHNYNNLFCDYGIYTINDLYKYMNDNFEYGGILIYNNERLKLPFGPVFGVAKHNIITRYQNEKIFKFIIDFYSRLDEQNETVNYVKEQYYHSHKDICDLKEYQQIIYKVSMYVQKNMWRQRNVSEILNDQISNCYESSFLVGEFLKSRDIKYQKYVIGRYDNIYLAHEFITYNIEGKYYYFEHALRDFKGIYEYDSKEEMEQDIFVKFIYYDNNKLEQKINFDNYFLKPIDDLDPNGNFSDYFEYFDTVQSIPLRKNNYDIFFKLIDMLFKEMIGIGSIYTNDNNLFYDPIELPFPEDFYDFELWKKEVWKIMRKNIINIGFYIPDRLDSIYKVNALGGFTKYNNIIDVKGAKTRAQLLPSKYLVSSIYTISDLKNELLVKNISKIKDILVLNSSLINKKDLYEYGCYFATNLSRETLKLANNINKDKICILDDIDLNGKIIGTEYVLSNDNFLEQVVAIASAIKVVSEAISLVVNKDYSHDFINTFVDYFVYMIDVSTIDIDKISNINKNYNDDFEEQFISNLLNKLFDKLHENEPDS